MKRALLVLGTVLTLGLALAGATTSDPRYAFSHAEHAARDPASVCIDCHDVEHAAPADGRPGLRTAHCGQCHDEVPAIAPRVNRATLSVVFDHRQHAGAIKGTCTSCHARGVTADDTHVEHALTATPALCFSCHAQSSAAPREQACLQCHGRDERKVEPATHAPSWRRAHGASAVAFAPVAHGQSCTLCHRESSCKTCHRVERPDNHSNLWTERGHGIVASFDSARCKTCHESGQCISCHRTTEPSNHRGAWKATHGLVARGREDSSCKTCHQTSFCVDCHRGGK